MPARTKEMMDLRIKNSILINRQVFNVSNWLTRPALVKDLLSVNACNAEYQDVAALSAYFLFTLSIDFPANPIAHKAPCDAFLILGHELNPDGTPKPELVSRLETALGIRRQYPAAKLVVTGGGQARGVKEADVMKRWLKARGVSDESILVECRSRDTVENITLSTAVLAQEKFKNVCLITGAQHIHRASHVLSLHLSKIGAEITPSYLASVVPGRPPTLQDASARERFLLFKDLGRVLGIWQYHDWTMQPGPGINPGLC